jgi:GMP synthase (glutamine-hydrolysing)
VGNAHEPHHAFRLGDRAWGVQFHPKFTAPVMRAYVRVERTALAAAGYDVSTLLTTVRDTPIAAQVLKRFGTMVRDIRSSQPLDEKG